MEELTEIHKKVKEHRFRLNLERKYRDSYRELLHKLSHEFYVEVSKTKYKSSRNFIHDFNLGISNVGRENFIYESFWAFHVECCISVIHRFIDTGTVPYYFDTYKEDGKRKQARIVFDESIEKYTGFIEYVAGKPIVKDN